MRFNTANYTVPSATFDGRNRRCSLVCKPRAVQNPVYLRAKFGQ